MSFWTQVDAYFEFESYEMKKHKGDKEKLFDQLFGKVCRYEDLSSDTWKDILEHPDNYLPCGSEGTLKRMVWKRKGSDGSTRYLVNIHGGLRDFWEAEPIKTWFKKVCRSPYISSAHMSIELEGLCPEIIVYSDYCFDDDRDFPEYGMKDPHLWDYKGSE